MVAVLDLATNLARRPAKAEAGEGVDVLLVLVQAEVEVVPEEATSGTAAGVMMMLLLLLLRAAAVAVASRKVLLRRSSGAMP